MTPDERHADELLAAYALDAVDPDERVLVERHLEDHPAARAEADRLRHAASALGATAPAGDPPAGAWERLADRLALGAQPSAHERADDAVPPLRHPEPKPLGHLPAADDSSTSRPVLLPGSTGGRPRHRTQRAFTLVAVAAVSIAALVVSSLAWRASRREPAPAGPQAELARASALPTSRVGFLRSPDGRLSVRGVVTADGQGYLDASGLPPLDPDRTYQLWGLDGSAPVSLGVIGPDPTVVAFAAGPTERHFAVTAEPAGGTTVATGQPLVSGQLA
jgi:anti-sigma-K factor RskA